MKRVIGVGVAVVLVSSVALAADVKRGVGGPETHESATVRIPAVRRSGDDAAVIKLPKGMLAPGQGPFPNVPRTDAEGTTPAKLKLSPPS